MSISTRAMGMPASPIRKLVPYAEAAKRRGTKVFHLNIGQPDIPTPEAFYEFINKKSGKVVAYTQSGGMPVLKEAFSGYYSSWGIDIDPSELIVTTGGSEAILFAFAAIADPGDEIIAVEPFYANYRGFAHLMGLNIVPVTASVENGYRLPEKEEFLRAITPETRGIIVSNPSNPTGVVYTEEELQRLVDIAKENNIYLIVDEVYREFVFDNREAGTILKLDSSDNIIVVDSVSKRYSACGARIGALVTKNKEIISTVTKFAQARLAPPAISQMGTVGLLTKDREYMKSVKDEYESRRNVVFAELSKIEGVTLHKPQGAFYVSVKLPVDDSEEFVKWMLTDFSLDGETVMVAPLGGFYGTENAGKSEIRIAYVLEKEKLRKACHILAKGLEAYNK